MRELAVERYSLFGGFWYQVVDGGKLLSPSELDALRADGWRVLIKGGDVE